MSGINFEVVDDGQILICMYESEESRTYMRVDPVYAQMIVDMLQSTISNAITYKESIPK